MIVGGAVPRPYSRLQYLHTPCRGGAVPLPAILLKIALPQAIRTCGWWSLAPRVYEGGAPTGAGGANTWYRTPPVSFADSPLLKAGAEGAVHDCGRGTAPPLQGMRGAEGAAHDCGRAQNRENGQIFYSVFYMVSPQISLVFYIFLW